MVLEADFPTKYVEPSLWRILILLYLSSQRNWYKAITGRSCAIPPPNTAPKQQITEQDVGAAAFGGSSSAGRHRHAVDMPSVQSFKYKQETLLCMPSMESRDGASGFARQEQESYHDGIGIGSHRQS
jgi:hypothetical protein